MASRKKKNNYLFNTYILQLNSLNAEFKFKGTF